MLALISPPSLLCALVAGPWSSRALPPKQRAVALANAMTLEEQLSLLHGPAKGPSAQCALLKNFTHPWCTYVGNIAGIERLGVPPTNMNDGPQGFRAPRFLGGTSTAWP